MNLRSLQRLRYLIEVFLSRGAAAQLALVATLILLISLVFGALEHSVTDGESRSLGESIWWAFLRLTDPGYLGDDSGVARRSISTALTVLGYVLFMGSLVAILTQWLNRTIQNLEAGYTPIIRDHHILVAGSTEKAELVVQSVFESYGRARRFLVRRGKGKQLHVVLLSDQAGAELRLRLRNALGSKWHSQHFTMRKGVPWDNDDLSRVDFSRASVVILPAKAASLAQSTDADNETIKTLLSASHFFSAKIDRELPGIVVEIYDARKLGSINSAYHGPVHCVPSSQLVAQLITQSLIHPGIARVYAELMEHNEGNEVYLREGQTFAGLTLRELTRKCPSSVPIGVVPAALSNESTEARFSMRLDRVIKSSDLVTFIAPSFDEAGAESKDRDEPTAIEASLAPRSKQSHARARIPDSLLILGWNRKGSALVEELLSDSIVSPSNIHISARIDIDALEGSPTARGLKVHRLDNTIPNELASIEPQKFGCVVILSSDWLKDEGRADARAIATLLSLEHILQKHSTGRGPHIVMELLDPTNEPVTAARVDDLLISTDIIGHLLAQIALRPEIKVVFDTLLAKHGPSIDLRKPGSYGYEPGQAFHFRELQERAQRRGEIAIGVYDDGKKHDRVVLNPPKDLAIQFTRGTRLIVVSPN